MLTKKEAKVIASALKCANIASQKVFAELGSSSRITARNLEAKKDAKALKKLAYDLNKRLVKSFNSKKDILDASKISVVSKLMNQTARVRLIAEVLDEVANPELEAEEDVLTENEELENLESRKSKMRSHRLAKANKMRSRRLRAEEEAINSDEDLEKDVLECDDLPEEDVIANEEESLENLTSEDAILDEIEDLEAEDEVEDLEADEVEDLESEEELEDVTADEIEEELTSKKNVRSQSLRKSVKAASTKRVTPKVSASSVTALSGMWDFLGGKK